MSRTDNFNSFFQRIENEKKRERNRQIIENSVPRKREVIRKERINGREKVAEALFGSLYRRSLPISQEYKNADRITLEKKGVDFIKSRSPKGVYAYIQEYSKTSPYAKKMCTLITEAVDEELRKYEMDIENTPIDDITIDVHSKEGTSILTKIEDKMDYEEVSNIIRSNVQNMVTTDIKRTKEEEQAMKELEEEIAANSEIMTESAIDRELRRRGLHNKKYEPSLFEGIMVSKVQEFTESAEELGYDDELINKKAFYESVTELTKWAMLSVLNFEPMKTADWRRLATKYARKEM